MQPNQSQEIERAQEELSQATTERNRALSLLRAKDAELEKAKAEAQAKVELHTHTRARAHTHTPAPIHPYLQTCTHAPRDAITNADGGEGACQLGHVITRRSD